MPSTTLIWTSLPAGVRRGSDAQAWRARISVLLTPRLETPAGPLTLADFPDFLDWPDTLRSRPGGLSFTVSLRTGVQIIAASEARAVQDPAGAWDSELWQSVFHPATPVTGFGAGSDTGDTDLGAAPAATRSSNRIAAYDTAELAKEIRGFYADALRHDLGLVAEAPTLQQFAVPEQALLGTAPINSSAMERFARFHRRGSPTLRSAGNAQLQAPYQALDTLESPDFHQRISALGAHPFILRKLGLLLDVELSLEDLPLDELLPERSRGPAAIRVVPNGLDLNDTFQKSPWIATDYRRGPSEVYRLFNVAERDAGKPTGVFSLASRTSITQEKLEHAAMTLMQQAGINDENPNREKVLPALLQGGMRVSHADVPHMLAQAMDEQAELERALGEEKAAAARGLLGSSDTDEALDASQLTLGVRADVRQVAAGEWRSLCERSIQYQLGDRRLTAQPVNDEGFIEPTIYSDEFANPDELRTSCDLFEWDGWSLVVPRPGEDSRDTAVLPAATLAPGSAPLTANIAVAPGSLEPQRFGRCYSFRTRSVYLGGVGLSSAEANEIDFDAASVFSAPNCCLRVESAKPPVTVRAQDRGYGEAGDIIVLREADDSAFATGEYKLHVLPPEVPLYLAEKHGVFDQLSPRESWELLASHRGKLERDEDGSAAPNGDAADGDTRSETVTAKELFAPYLPDPMVKQAVLCLPDGAGSVDLPRFDDLTGAAKNTALARSCGVVFRITRDKVTATVRKRDAVIALTRGRVHTLRLAAKLSSEELAISALAHADWIGPEAAVAAQPRLAKAAACGEASLVAPGRDIRVLCATQRPLEAPAFGRALILPRHPNDSSARLADDALQFDRQSTGRIDVYAHWEDPVDQPDADRWTSLTNRMHAGGVDIDLVDGKPLDPMELAQVDRSPLAHDFGDTRHREVRYTAVASSRFADFYPPEVTDDPSNITRSSEPVILHVPSTAPPKAPEIAYVLPTYKNVQADPVDGINNEYTLAQRGEGLRVYLQRGWFSSGAGEQLALLVATPTTPAALRDQVSEWGINPLRDSAPLPGPLELSQLWGGSRRLEHWPMDGGSVGLIIYDVHWSEEHKLPFVDIEFMSQRSFMPLVRLALARYQAYAIEHCELSRVVHADFVPLTPGRALTVKQLNPATWLLEMRGYSYMQATSRLDPDAPGFETSVVEAQIQIAPRDTPEDHAAWRPLGDPRRLRPNALEPWRMHWTGQLGIDDPDYLTRHWRRRLLIQEYEVFAYGGQAKRPTADHSRLISAHAIRI